MTRAWDGCPLAVQVSGPAEAPALLLLQGQSNSHTWWQRTRGEFEPQIRTITFDYRGTGRSRGPMGDASSSGFAADAVAVLDFLGIPGAAVYGTSMGGRIAQMIAIDHPDRVDALVLGCTTPGGSHAIKRPRQVGRALATLRGAEYLDYLHSLFYTPDWPGTPTDSTLLGDPSMSSAESAAHLRISAEHDAWDRLPSITAPTLVIHGDADLMNPVGNARLLHERIPDSRLVILPGGRHGFFEEFADQVTPEIIGFLADPNG
ncbi:pimeloyl-ACP methyl ester carboxylesterase [Brevibacterium sanguinis]|uniref:Pimeloyl-ACP methyl ester carboxylesterase n=2 Tax=Brevibacterium TaxID=1696 RepID=A0A366IP94_9MICO|nr:MULTISPECIES: alpha/beta hydrolase [Brevibacterium]RBP67075.1 pimeloyl-ACP methyl ester carboxylesterase [Brevibacterium sanguinis]RBP73600.1 pimeloyl-ACP methyl ester carboxylesterase [Brevibacterium celere]